MIYDEIVPVLENRPLAGGHFLLSLHSPRQAQAVRAGQFAMIRLLGHSDVLLRRPMSIYDLKSAEGRSEAAAGTAAHSPGSDPAEIPTGSPAIIQVLYKVVGRGTRLMAQLKPGDEVGLLAPLGHGFFEPEYLEQAKRAEEVLQVAGGIGIAALLLPARDMASAGIQQSLFFGGRSREDLVGIDDFAPLVRQIVLATEDGSCGQRGYVTIPLEAYLERRRDARFLIIVCGPWGMLKSSVELARKYNHSCLLSMENRMGCGLGVCLGCCIRVDGTGHGAYQRVCTEGPVFWAEKISWETEALPRNPSAARLP